MSALAIAIAGESTMSSREIAELTGSTHDNVLKTIRSLVQRGVVSGNETPYTHPQNGRTYPEFKLGFRDTMVVVSGYSVELRARIIDRWQELESDAAEPTFNPSSLSRLQLIQLAMDAENERLALAHKVAEQAPLVTFAGAVLNADDTLLIRDVAKTLGVGVLKLYAALRAKGVLLANNAPAAAYVAKGYLVESIATYETDAGTQFNVSARVTGRGIEFLRRFVARHPDLFSEREEVPA